MDWLIRWIHNPVQSRRIWIGPDQKFPNSADSGLDWIQKRAVCHTQQTVTDLSEWPLVAPADHPVSRHAAGWLPARSLQNLFSNTDSSQGYAKPAQQPASRHRLAVILVRCLSLRSDITQFITPVPYNG